MGDDKVDHSHVNRFNTYSKTYIFYFLESWRQGLFVHCIEEDIVPPLPFNLDDPVSLLVDLNNSVTHKKKIFLKEFTIKSFFFYFFAAFAMQNFL